MAEIQQQDPISALLTEFGTRLNEVEEKQRLLRDRALLIGSNLISLREENEEQLFEIKKQLKELNTEIKGIKQMIHRIVNEIPNLARKSELDILKNQAQLFQPLELAKVRDVELLIEKKLGEKK